jgi:sensor domain CHASE-containing protein
LGKEHDIYAFVKNQSVANPSKQAIDTWINIGANYILIYNTTGQLVAGAGFNLTTYQHEPIPESLSGMVSENSKLWNLKGTDKNAKGVIAHSSGPLLVVSNSISSSNVGDPGQGTVVMARYLDSEKIASLSRNVQFPVTCTLFSEWQVLNGRQTVTSPLPMTFSEP